MELLVGRDMESLVRTFGQQPPERVVHLLEQVCESLGEAHSVGLVHRDIKPSNILRLPHRTAVRLRQGARLRARQTRVRRDD
jgi:serine/threonine protein kinase